MIKKHWNREYIVSRVKEWNYRRTHPWYPWISRKSIEFLELWITKDSIGAEFGSGRSTVWFAKRCKHITSVEDNAEWFGIVQKKLSDEGLKNVDYFLKRSEWIHGNTTEYTDVLKGFQDNSLDFVLVDGSDREPLIITSPAKVKVGGVLIVDNIHWFVPSKSKSPSARTEKDGYSSTNWEKFFETMTKTWKVIWTSDGVSDTALFIKLTAQ